MSTSERDFNNFYLGDNVYELADGVIPEIAERLDVSLGKEPNSVDLQHVMEKVGLNKVLRQNQEIEAIDRPTMATLLVQSGVQLSLRRSLWTPESPVTVDSIDAITILTAVANWQDRTAAALSGLEAVPVYSAGGIRIMDTDTEKSNENVKELFTTFKRYPKEAEYAGSVIIPKLVAKGHSVLPHSYDTKNGDEILQKLFENNPHLLDERIAMARVANAGIIMAIQMREAARKINPDFDTDPANPQAFMITDEFPVSSTEEDDERPAEFQKASTGLRQLVLTAKKVHEAAGGE